MKKITVRLKKDKNILKLVKTTGLYFIGIVVALLLTYWIYPKYSLSKMNMEIEVVDNVGDYFYGDYIDKGGKRYHFRGDAKEIRNIGDRAVIEIKAKDHPKYGTDRIVIWSIIILSIYSVALILLGIPVLGSIAEDDCPEIVIGFYATAIVGLLYILTKWWI